MGRHPLYEVPGDLSPEEIHKYRKRLRQKASRRRQKQQIKEMKTELNDFRYNAGMAAIVDASATGKELTTAPPLELPHEDRVKVAKFLMEAQVAPDNDVLADCFRQALRVLIQHKMDFGIFILGKAIVENSRGEPSRDDGDHEDSNGGS